MIGRPNQPRNANRGIPQQGSFGSRIFSNAQNASGLGGTKRQPDQSTRGFSSRGGNKRGRLGRPMPLGRPAPGHAAERFLQPPQPSFEGIGLPPSVLHFRELNSKVTNQFNRFLIIKFLKSDIISLQSGFATFPGFFSLPYIIDDRRKLAPRTFGAIPGYTNQLSKLTVIFAGYNQFQNLKFSAIQSIQGHGAIGAHSVDHWLENARVFQLRGQTSIMDPVSVILELRKFLEDYNILRNPDGSVVSGDRVLLMAGIGDIPTTCLAGTAPSKLIETLRGISSLGLPVIFLGVQEVPFTESIRGQLFKKLIDYLSANRDELTPHRVKYIDIFTPTEVSDLQEVFQPGKGQVITESSTQIERVMPFIQALLRLFSMGDL
jgi:hypothetical protein